MSVLMELRFPGESAALQRSVEQNRDEFLSIAKRAKERGAIHHSFYAHDGEIVVVDEWESAEAFQAFYAAEEKNIGKLMSDAGIAGPSDRPAFFEKLELGDEF